MLHTFFFIWPEYNISRHHLFERNSLTQSVKIMCCSVKIFLRTACVYHCCTDEMRTINTIITFPISTKHIFHSEIFFCSGNKSLTGNTRNSLSKPGIQSIYSSNQEYVDFLNIHRLFYNFPHLSHHWECKSREQISTGRNKCMEIPEFISEKSDIETNNKIGHDSNGQLSSP